MASTSFVTVTGLRELDELLKALPAKIEGKVMRGALRAGQKVMLDGARVNLAANGNIKTGALSKSVHIAFKRKSEAFGWVRSYLVAGNQDVYYAHMIEFGTASFYTGKGKTVGNPYEIRPRNRKSLFFAGLMREVIVHPGIHPQPFMRLAFDTQGEASVKAIAAYIQNRLPLELKKVAS